jgi:hypothetical protein
MNDETAKVVPIAGTSPTPEDVQAAHGDPFVARDVAEHRAAWQLVLESTYGPIIRALRGDRVHLVMPRTQAEPLDVVLQASDLEGLRAAVQMLEARLAFRRDEAMRYALHASATRK